MVGEESLPTYPNLGCERPCHRLGLLANRWLLSTHQICNIALEADVDIILYAWTRSTCNQYVSAMRYQCCTTACSLLKWLRMLGQFRSLCHSLLKTTHMMIAYTSVIGQLYCVIMPGWYELQRILAISIQPRHQKSHMIMPPFPYLPPLTLQAPLASR